VPDSTLRVLAGGGVLLVLAAMAMFIVLLISFPWETLSILSVFYLLLIPFSVRSYRRHKMASI